MGTTAGITGTSTRTAGTPTTAGESTITGIGTDTGTRTGTRTGTGTARTPHSTFDTVVACIPTQRNGTAPPEHLSTTILRPVNLKDCVLFGRRLCRMAYNSIRLRSRNVFASRRTNIALVPKQIIQTKSSNNNSTLLLLCRSNTRQYQNRCCAHGVVFYVSLPRVQSKGHSRSQLSEVVKVNAKTKLATVVAT